MDLKYLKEQLKSNTRLSVPEQFKLKEEILKTDPSLIYPWYWLEPCEVKVLIVVDGLNFGISTTGLSGFLSIFKKLEQESNVHINYKVTLADRRNVNINGQSMQGGNPDFDKRVINFKFDNDQHFSDTMYDQVWLFGIASTSNSLTNTEASAIESYMNKGGGLFATGDHGALGKSLCGIIPRVKDMRYWDDTTPSPIDPSNEVSMRGPRRNDTNQPKPGDAASTDFSNQADDIPQTIHAKLYNGLPHPLLAISTSIVPSGILQQMPDHPHEGECKPETDFTVTNPKTGQSQTIRTQNIAISFVTSGNITNGKVPTDPHCFPSISVFDGKQANVGRIVIDSTWHHFVNVNLNGLLPNSLAIIEEYFKNIAKWMTRKKNMLCLYKRILVLATLNDRIMESNMQNPDLPLSQIKDEELISIGTHAIQYMSENHNSSFGMDFAISLIEPLLPDLTRELNPWIEQRTNNHTSPWLNPEGILQYGIGSGIVNLSGILEANLDKPISPELEEEIDRAFFDGAKVGIKKGFSSFQESFSGFNNNISRLTTEDHKVFGKVTDVKGNPLSGVVLKAVDKDFTGENLLGSKTLTEKDGSYKINYRQTDFVINGKESGGANIVIYVYDKEGELIYTSKVYNNSPKETEINIELN
ncbi:hypothetical protein NBT05_02565 [Aquimarina sp. ERC-38]|uniref:hypothetical protein n=1 Tax=Aquimarina sp. ERC-38 TaxID=2949996 RepID=UPI00224715AD|nr:hypothetical protein [Aquimarina sp. ERC-38]UZO81365.1 hypothetical protein NBT05_02565 [Aquimarina sp. ERC-38]